MACKAIYAGSIPAAASTSKYKEIQRSTKTLLASGFKGFFMSNEVQWNTFTTTLKQV
ncbi:hypothetical protein CRENPOLYSF2_160027 [Crenothrix polyspora]|uniref:Uncharacterized protein n=1 Tax=Crenothrix polyspora TaxID=360316 RepID=A0A1R4H2F3_9GAMM|nr:hypothetical protein CRENPOLYSF2_160027 [Crenothrix polyspora]